MRHRFQAVFITHFKLLFLIGAVFFLCGFSFPKNSDLIQIKVVKIIDLPKGYHEGLYFDGKNIWVNNGRKGNTWVIDTSNGSKIKEISPAGIFTESVTAKDKDTFFVTDWDLKKIYTAHIENNNMYADSEFSVAPAFPAGALWNGKNLFVITWTRGITGTKFDILKMDDKFKIITKKRIGNIQEPAHIAWDGKNLWISSWYSKRIYKVDPEKFDVLGYFRSPADMATGIAWDGSYLWLTGTYDDLYEIELQPQGG